MRLDETLTLTRHASNPMLSDMPVLETDGSTADVFYTPAGRRIERHLSLIVATASGACLLIAWVISLTNGPAPLRNLFTLFAFAIAGVPALSQVWGKLSAFKIDIDALMLLGAGLAVWIGSPFEGALLLFLFALSGGLEHYSLGRTQSAIIALRDLAPKEAIVLEDGQPRRVALRQVGVGAIVLVKPGEKVPLDGVVVGGASSVDESAITGESMPRDCKPDDVVFAGTQNIDGRLEVRTTRTAGDTTLAKIVKLVTEARDRPARAQRMIDRIGPTYSIVVIASAVLVGLGGVWLAGLETREAVRRAIALLIVASPCALIIATPVAYLSAIAAAARRGVLVKGGSHLEMVARATVIAFDKTGTLTTGHIRLTDIDIDANLDESEALRFAGGIEASSTHPLACAVNEALTQRNIQPHPVTKFRATPGEGVEGEIKGCHVWIGRPESLESRCDSSAARQALDRTEAFRKSGKTVAALVIDDMVGLLAFQDTVREEAADCVRQLREQGIERIEMLTGDHRIIAGEVASRLGLDGFQAELKPQDKLDAVERLRANRGVVVLVGDGINDAPALAHADAGLAMGGLGADVAMEAADIVIMKDRIERVAWLHRHAQRTAHIVRQNLTFAIGVISVLSVFATLGSIPLPLAVIGHEGSTVLVALNALRLLRTPKT